METLAEGRLSRPLWDHQQRGLSEFWEAVSNGERQICLTSPTGGGKTRIATELITEATDRDWNTVLYTNRKLLIDQTTKVIARAGIDHGIRASGHQDNRQKRVQISSIQTENARVLKTAKWQALHDANLVIIDEAHLNKSAVAQKIIASHLEAGAVVVGLTATPIELGHLYTKLIVAGTNSELRKCGALIPCHTYGPDEPDCRKIKRQKSGDYSENDIRKVIMTSTIFGRVLESWKKLNPDGLPTILFAPGVAESIWFAEQFSARGIRAAHIDGAETWVDGEFSRTSADARQRIIDGSRDGSIKVICNRFVLREGIDLPWLFHGIFATVFGSLQSYLQSGGRLLRSHPSLKHVILQDHGGNWWRHGSLNVDRQWDLNHTNNMIAGEREEAMREKKIAEPIRCPQCSAVRNGGPICPLCGFECHKKSRPVVQADGSLKEMTGDIFKARKVQMRNDTVDLWTRMYYRMKRAKHTFRQAEALFFVENHYWPPRDLPLMPIHSVDWYRGVHEVDAGRLMK